MLKLKHITQQQTYPNVAPLGEVDDRTRYLNVLTEGNNNREQTNVWVGRIS
jgi:hypothetical protein